MLETLLADHSKILAECAIAERLRRNPAVTLHPTLYNAPLVYGPVVAQSAMAEIYGEYITAAAAADLPLLLTSPTWRVDKERIAEAGINPNINADAVAFMLSVRDKFSVIGAPLVLVGALTGPKGDCYRPDLAPNAVEAEEFHSQQINELAVTDADFLQTQTLPSVTEALGIARAMAKTGKPYVISFCTGSDGKVLDGHSLPEAFRIIDEDVQLIKAPTAYYVNCTHPQFLLDHYEIGELDRLKGIQANGSSKDVTKLDGSSETIADPVSDWAEAMLKLHEYHGVQILGGCCGTGLEHMQALVR